MKTIAKLFLCIMVLITATTHFSQAQSRLSKTSTRLTPANVIKAYASDKSKCLGFTIATNEGIGKPQGEPTAASAPVTTWVVGAMNKKNGSCAALTSINNAKRYWSNRTYGPQNDSPFEDNKTDNVKLSLVACGSTITAKLVKNNSTTFNIKILGVVKSKQGHVLYGTYGNHNGMITISLFNSGCPQG